MKKKPGILIFQILAMGLSAMITISCSKTADENTTVKDIDGNVYKTVTIGNQVWMAENLKTINFNDGTPITLVTGNSAWGALTTPGYCWYANEEATSKATFGALYNYYTVKTGNLCPTGWHMPSDGEWTTLTTYLGGDSIAGRKLKETGITHWQTPNTGATNETGFNALPGGYRTDTGPYNSIGQSGYWWSSTGISLVSSWNRTMSYAEKKVERNGSFTQNGFSVRCIRN